MRKILLSLILLPSMALAEPNLQDGLESLKAGDYDRALLNIQPLALNGDPEAEFRLCGMYFLGRGVAKNNEEAIRWCKNAANKGHLEAMYNTGLFYQQGEAVPMDIEEALKWYKMAASRGHSDAAFNISQLENAYKTSFKPAPAPAPAVTAATAAPMVYNYASNQPAANLTEEQYCKMAAERGNPDPKCPNPKAAAAIEPAAADISAPKPQTGLTKRSLEWYVREATLGDPHAQNNLGVIYRRGKGVEPDAKEAFKWFEKSAARGSAKGMMNLASMYKMGEGTPQNLELAYSWYNLASDRFTDIKDKQKALENVKKVAAHMNNEQIGNALNYVTQLDEAIPYVEETAKPKAPAASPQQPAQTPAPAQAPRS